MSVQVTYKRNGEWEGKRCCNLIYLLEVAVSSWNSPNITHLTFAVKIAALLIKNARRAAGWGEKMINKIDSLPAV